MRRGSLSNRQRQVLAAVREATSGATNEVSGFEVFELLRATGAPGTNNHGRVFNALRELTAAGYLSVHIETLSQVPWSRALYSLTSVGSASAPAELRGLA